MRKPAICEHIKTRSRKLSSHLGKKRAHVPSILFSIQEMESVIIVVLKESVAARGPWTSSEDRWRYCIASWCGLSYKINEMLQVVGYLIAGQIFHITSRLDRRSKCTQEKGICHTCHIRCQAWHGHISSYLPSGPNFTAITASV